MTRLSFLKLAGRRKFSTAGALVWRETTRAAVTCNVPVGECHVPPRATVASGWTTCTPVTAAKCCQKAGSGEVRAANWMGEAGAHRIQSGAPAGLMVIGSRPAAVMTGTASLTTEQLETARPLGPNSID